jgi:hypothetical protein
MGGYPFGGGYFAFYAFVFIPPPVGGGGTDEVIHLGTKESMGVTSVPSIGGWNPW